MKCSVDSFHGNQSMSGSIQEAVKEQLENVFWCRDAQQIISCHNDGGYNQWDAAGEPVQQSPMESKVPYGPFRCKAIGKITWLTTRRGSPYIVFQGGMPMASYGDRHSISVVHGSQQIAFDFTSRIIDHLVIANPDPSAECDDPRALLVLAEEELVAIDLQTPGWPVIQCPYLVSLHCSAITCSHHISSIPLKLWERIIGAGRKQNTHYSTMPWPIDGGVDLAPAPPQRDLLLTGLKGHAVKSTSIQLGYYSGIERSCKSGQLQGARYSGKKRWGQQNKKGKEEFILKPPNPKNNDYHQGGGAYLSDAALEDFLERVTRHEDGTVRFWDASGVCLQLLYKMSTVGVFQTDSDPNDNLNSHGEEEWPPLRKVSA
ncbi:hypothetical protein AB205_0034190 [Aquarana catesbeiana]|uniref:Lethal giant larvae homologue 2 domain-containing protein n=1 Tax=Aquarana catesbeiana TaxID=8400 RepID=A0A2G9SEP0_AQUCT|nr:hypothetical protein AB205_0034190 [Aquarana catesbeiana]